MGAPEVEREPVQKPTPADERSETPKPAALVFTWPVKGEVLRDFSVETLSLDPPLEDWRPPAGRASATAPPAGTVTPAHAAGLMATTVAADHGKGLTTLYANLAQQPTVKAGDAVETGTILGTGGGTAIAESGMDSHLHLEAWDDGAPVAPMDYLPEK